MQKFAKVWRYLLKNCKKVLRKFWESCEKVVKKVWKRYKKVVRKLWESCEKDRSVLVSSHATSQNLKVILWNRRHHDHGFSFQAKGHGCQRLSKFGKYYPYIKFNKKYVDISKWTTIMGIFLMASLRYFVKHIDSIINLLCSKIIQLAIINFHCPGVTHITISRRNSHYSMKMLVY